MKIIAPDYYTKFKCIAEKCRHNCCIGWEIDIDEKTAQVYRNHTGVLKQRFEKNISYNGTSARFILDENERCPFLNKNNLCDIFITMGEENLCNICTDHPRFRNFYSSVTETGLGLCCEAACNLILHSTNFNLVEIESGTASDALLPEEAVFFELRQQIFDIINNSAYPLDKRLIKIMTVFDMSLDDDFFENPQHLFENLEYMETDISQLIASSSDSEFESDMFENAFKQLACYFVYRHFADALDDGMYIQRLAFAAFSVKAIEYMCKSRFNTAQTVTFEDLAEFARIYSAEIEYSDENIGIILERITDKFTSL